MAPRVLIMNQQLDNEHFDPSKLFENHRKVKSYDDIPAARGLLAGDSSSWDLLQLVKHMTEDVKLLYIVQMIDVAESQDVHGPSVLEELLIGKTANQYYAAEYLLATRNEVQWNFKHYESLLRVYVVEGLLKSAWRCIQTMIQLHGWNIFNTQHLDVTDVFVTALREGMPLAIGDIKVENKGVGMTKKTAVNKSTESVRPKEPPTKKSRVEYSPDVTQQMATTSVVSVQSVKKKVGGRNKLFGKRTRNTRSTKVIPDPSIQFVITDKKYKLRGATGLTKHMTKDFVTHWLKPYALLDSEQLGSLETAEWHMKEYHKRECAIHILLYGHDNGGEILQGRWWHQVWERTSEVNDTTMSPCHSLKNVELLFGDFKRYADDAIIHVKWDAFKKHCDSYDVADNKMFQRRAQFDRCERIIIKN